MSGRLQADRSRAEAASERLREIASPARLQILSLLLSGEHAVAAIEAQLGLRQPSLSQHLAALRKAGLVASRRAAKSVFYRLSGVEAETLVAVIDGLLGAETPAVANPRPPTPPASIAPPRRNAGASAFARTAHPTPLPALRRLQSTSR